MTQFDKLPFEIQERMLEEQVKQGNPRDLNAFRNSIQSEFKGFSWDEAKEGGLFWMDILMDSNVETFFEKYPRNKSNFKLPENWHVVVTEENREVLSEWRWRKGHTHTLIEVGRIVGMVEYALIGNYKKGHNYQNCVKSDTYDFGIEITFNQFKFHVMGEKNKEELTFPREMWCWDGDKEKGVKATVLIILPDRRSVYKVIADNYVFRYCEELKEEKIVELTFQDISNGKGVGVDPKLIRVKE
jgi:hypothetical protein